MNKAKYYLGICAVLNMTIELCLTFFFSFYGFWGIWLSFFRVDLSMLKQNIKCYPSYM